jgi:predicted Zn-dependent protease
MTFTAIFSIIRSQWKALLPIILIGLMYWYVQHLKNARDFWESSYKTAIAGYQAESKLRIEENERKDALAKQANEKADDAHKKELAALAINSIKERDALKAKLTKELEIKNANEKLFNMRLNAAYDRVQLESNISSITRSETASETGHTEATRERDGTDSYTRTLERACAITTSDFNRASQWIEDVCLIYKCSK